ncbi:hypothetical protein MKK75_04760 [Methylobacterium sp. J-030]|uniref:hypothetical protein n=1 Tax=Methylobacterium sp. J-030 TaxID=2836627 RepID=UPI001FB9D0D1|nr:hypothetical protein [Methylobacterium sp. J-030]MCJ2068127.1 hypothetical protein [Methylobacterium sp. J-030]
MLFQDAPPLRIGVSADARAHSAAEGLAEAKPTAAEKRRSSRTHRMIMGLPSDGAVVIVHSPACVGIYRDTIAVLREPEVAACTRVVAAPNIADERAVTARLSLPVFRDHFVDEQREHARAVLQASRL